ncbi:helix-turn-helix domain-containing protein [Companilactobacillus zhachilii]|uniref:helix-turn-helix domain-containing protein n=1 Tax=Companilactobacillus zhachilii TaxID=2304606 RepID=UPI004033F3E4
MSSFNKTPNEFLNDYRMSLATMLLTDSEQTLADISDTCGFQTASYFGRRFKQSFGTTPKQYRMKIMNK